MISPNSSDDNENLGTCNMVADEHMEDCAHVCQLIKPPLNEDGNMFDVHLYCGAVRTRLCAHKEQYQNCI